MKKLTPILALTAVLLLLAAAATAHPHLRKTVTAVLEGNNEVSVSYVTAPSNEEHAKNAPVGQFTSARAKLTLSADLKAGDVSIPAGEYSIGAIKNSDTDWTLALYPGQVARGASPDLAKVIKLQSTFDTDHGVAEHVVIDLQPGSGPLSGKTTLTWHFGSLHVAGALS